jgi:hypothetical protein
MNPIPTARSIARPALALASAAMLVFSPAAYALAPQDSLYPEGLFPRESGEEQKSPLIAAGKVFYVVDQGSGTSRTLGVRARNFQGDLVFEKLDSRANLDQNRSSRYGVSADGRLYYMRQTTPSGAVIAGRVVVTGADGVEIGTFGPNGNGPGDFTVDSFQTSSIAVSPTSGRVYVTDEYRAQGTSVIPDPEKKGLVRVFDRDGNYLHQFKASGILADTLENYIHHIQVRGIDADSDEVFVVEQIPNVWDQWGLKVFRGDGQFIRQLTGTGDGNGLRNAVIHKDFLILRQTLGQSTFINTVLPATATSFFHRLAVLPMMPEMGLSGLPLGFDDAGRFLATNGLNRIGVFSYPNHATFDSASRNAVPNPWVVGIRQRPATGIVDIDYRVDDPDDASVRTALIAFADGTASLNNVLQMNTLLEETAGRVGLNQPTGQTQRVTWNAGADWNVDFGTLRVMALARDSRAAWFDTHIVEIPADGTRPAVAIHRTPLTHEDFLIQFLWLVATKDSSVNLVDGVLFGTSGEYNGVILANGTTSTAQGRAFLLARDGLRIATNAEVTRAREGATPNFVVSLTPPMQLHRAGISSNPSPVLSPRNVNEFGIDSSWTLPSLGDAQGRWFVVKD